MVCRHHFMHSETNVGAGGGGGEAAEGEAAAAGSPGEQKQLT